MKKYFCVTLTVAVLACGFLPAARAQADAAAIKAAIRASNAERRAAQVPIQDEPGLPRVLLLGDSITMGYTISLRELLKGKANVHYPYENCHTSEQILVMFDKYLGDKPWDVIQFNCGLHDLTRTNLAGKSITNGETGVLKVPPAAYKKNLETLVTRLKATGAEIIWCSSTPVTNGVVYRRNDEIISYNAIAKEVMQARGIPITDLHAAASRHGTPKWLDYGHFTVEGAREQAREVLPNIEAALSRRSAAQKGKPAPAGTR